jgi:branched-chain amino acid transport system substrate-binding protein
MKNRGFTCIALIIWMVLLVEVLGCGQNKSIEIGFVAGLTGRVADLGIPGRNAALLAVEQCNAGGGIHGRPVHLIVRDDGQDAANARKMVSELIDRKAEAIIGPMTSSMAMATIDQVNAAPILMVSPTVTTTALTGRDDNFFRVLDDTSAYARKSARYQVENLGHRKAVAIYDSNNLAYTESWFQEFRRSYEASGGVFLLTRTYPSSPDTVFLDMVKELLSPEPDMIVIIASAVDAARICQQVRKIDSAVAITLSEWASTERFIELAGGAAEKVLMAQFFNRNDRSAAFLSFSRTYMERYGHAPGFAGVAAYDATQVVLEALARRERGKSLKETIIAIGEFQGLQQRIPIDRHGDARRATYLTEVRDGQYYTLE